MDGLLQDLRGGNHLLLGWIDIASARELANVNDNGYLIGDVDVGNVNKRDFFFRQCVSAQV